MQNKILKIQDHRCWAKKVIAKSLRGSFKENGNMSEFRIV